MKFTKMHGAGNDYVFIDCFNHSRPDDIPQLARRISNRHTGIGSDGLILMCPSDDADAEMLMYNVDGTLAQMCGNGIRCMAKYLYEHSVCPQENMRITTGTRTLMLSLQVEAGSVNAVSVNMGQPILKDRLIPTTLEGNPPIESPIEVDGRQIKVTCVSMGNPHCVVFVESISDQVVNDLGPQLESHEAFPERSNVEFVQIVARDEFNMRVWERGCGETQACGTGACATLVAGVLTNRLDRRAIGHLLGGDLELEWLDDDSVVMTGPAVEVFEGEWS